MEEINDFYCDTIFNTSTSSCTVRLPLSQIIQKTRALNINTSVWDGYSPMKEPLFIEVTVRDMHHGLTSEDALVGVRQMSSAVNTVPVRCTNPEFSSPSYCWKVQPRIDQFPGMHLQIPADRIVQDARVLILSIHGATAKDTAMHIHSLEFPKKILSVSCG